MEPSDLALLVVLGTADSGPTSLEEIAGVARLLAPMDWQPTTDTIEACVERAIVNSGYLRPQDRVVINLAPADLKKDAGAFDLPIAMGILVAMGQIITENLETFASVGELALDGTVRPVAGALSMAMEARARGVSRGGCCCDWIASAGSRG